MVIFSCGLKQNEVQTGPAEKSLFVKAALVAYGQTAHRDSSLRIYYPHQDRYRSLNLKL